jgi:hypothetical protein
MPHALPAASIHKEKQMTTTVGNVGLYLVNGTAGNIGLPGAPVLRFSLLVNAATGTVSGQARQTQAIPGPLGDVLIGNVTGQIRYTGLGQYTKIVSLTGSTVISVPPPAIGSYLAPFSAHFAIDDAWTGVGGWTLGDRSVDDIPVQADH